MPNNKDDLVRISFYLPEEIKLKLKHRAINKKISLSELLQKAIRLYLNKKPKK